MSIKRSFENNNESNFWFRNLIAFMRYQYRPFLLLLVLLVISAAVIFYKFPLIPQHSTFDEIEFTRLALSLKNQPYTPYSPLATGHTTMYFYMLLASLNTFGINIFALRLPSALFGVINVVLVFLVFRKVFEDKRLKKDVHEEKGSHKNNYWLMYNISSPDFIAFIIAFIFATLRWNINFARFSFEATLVLLLELCSVVCFLYFRDKKKLWYLGLSGIFAGLAYNSYTPGRLFFLLPLGLLVYDIGFKNFFKKNTLIFLATYLLPCIILMMPLTIYLSQHPDIRINQLSYFHNPKLSFPEKFSYLGENIWKNIGMFFWEGDLNGRHNYPGKPIMNPLLGLLFVSGIIYSLIKKRTFYFLFFVGYFILGLIPTLLTYPQENPNHLRAFTLIPSVLFFIGCAVSGVLGQPFIKNKLIIIAGIMILITASALYELRTYFIYQTQVFPHAFEVTGPLEYEINHYKLPHY